MDLIDLERAKDHMESAVGTSGFHGYSAEAIVAFFVLAVLGVIFLLSWAGRQASQETHSERDKPTP